MSEISQIMREVGVTNNTGSCSDKIQVEHRFMFDVSESFGKILKGIALGGLDLGRHVVHSFRIFAIASSVGIILWGASRLVEAFSCSKRLEESKK
jgi:hypothetical protein